MLQMQYIPFKELSNKFTDFYEGCHDHHDIRRYIHFLYIFNLTTSTIPYTSHANFWGESYASAIINMQLGNLFTW